MKTKTVQIDGWAFFYVSSGQPEVKSISDVSSLFAFNSMRPARWYRYLDYMTTIGYDYV